MRLIPERFRPKRRDPEGTMSLVEHLEELRRRLVISVVAIAVGSVVGWILYDAVIELLLEPYCDYWVTVPPENRPTDSCSLFFMGAVDPVLIKLKVVVFLGLFIALPVVLWELWAFIVPGLTQREKRLAVPFVASSVILFALGAYLAYATLPRALSFLLGFAGSEFAPLLTGDRFLSFVMLVALAFGLSFEFPIVLIFLTVVGVISTQMLRDWRRWAYLGISIFAAFITPSADPYTMLAMMLPMMLFYEAAIIVARLLKR
ncbi:MAG TPA: twin-arginine translocase subunit TatC [Actinomycetota bacterium]|nr:twin-arginine translocase subunit TatC [Actinomycetota bacterium]